MLHGSDLHTAQIIEELCSSPRGKPPLLLALVLGEHGQTVMEAVLAVVRPNHKLKFLDLLEIWTDRVSDKERGVYWGDRISRDIEFGG